MKFRPHTVFSFVFTFSIALSFAEITVTNSLGVAGPRIANGSDLEVAVPDWPLNGGNTVVVLFSAENAASMSATFAGEAMTVVEAFDDDRHFSAVAYLIDPVADIGEVLIEATNSGGSRMSHAYSVLSLASVGSVAGTDTRVNGNGGLLYSTSAPGGYVVAAAENNSFNYSTPVVVTGNPDVELVNQAVDGNCTILHVHGDVPEAGPFTDNYSGGLESAATVAFETSGAPPVADSGILSIERSGSVVTVRFRGVAGRTYQLNKSLDLDFALSDLKDSVLLEETGVGELQDTEASEDSAFYRLEEP